MLDKLIVGGKVVTDGEVAEGNIGIKGGTIAVIADPTIRLKAKETIDAKGKIVIPGAIDTHTHVNTFKIWGDLPFNSFEDMATGAAYGGITTMLIHLWGPEGMSMPDSIEGMIKEGEGSSVIDFSFHCGVRPSDEHIKGIPDAIRMGVPSFKFLMTYRKSGTTGRTVDDYYMIQGMEAIGANGGIALVHAENGLIIDYFEDKFTREGKVSPEYFLPSRPNPVEAEAIHRASFIANLTQCPLYIVHMSTNEGLDEIIQARSQGKVIYAETCPHYLCLTNEALVEGGVGFKVGPPLRTGADREALWKGIQSGFVETIGSDTGEFPMDLRELVAREGIFKALFGFPGIETLVPLLYSEGVAKGRITLTQMVKLVAENPAKIMKLYPRKGTIMVGSDADLVLIDPSIRWTIKATEQHSRALYSCYEGMQMIGKPVMSLVRGQVLLRDGKLERSPGFGRFIPRFNI
jgi:dihydropyrimidinase